MTTRRGLILNTKAEWRTVAVIVAVYAGTIAVVGYHERLGSWLTVLLLAWFGAWHLSMQHELLHGHPFSKSWMNDAVASVPVTLWIPFLMFKPDHLEHHRTDLTTPGIDNESFYVDPNDWEKMGPIRRAYYWANRTILFRIFVNTIVSTWQYHAAKLRMVAKGDRQTINAYLAHIVLLVPTIWLVTAVAGMPLWQYALGVTYGGRVLNAIRPFPEHKYQADVELRTAMIMAGPLMSLLMLNNNLHVPHHDEPAQPWYEYRKVAKRVNAEKRAEEAGLMYRGGYLEVFRKYSFKPIDAPVRQSA